MGNLAGLMQSYVDQRELNTLEGSARTNIPGVYLYRSEVDCDRKPLMYQSGIIVMGQGQKTVYFGDSSATYGAGDYLVLGVPLPLTCDARTDNGKPLLGITINVHSETLHKLVNLLSSDELGGSSAVAPAALDLGIQFDCLNDALNDCFKRLLVAMHNDRDAAVLGPAIVEEIVYRILIGDRGHVLFDLARHDSHYAKIAKSLKRLHRQYAEVITVESLAEQANMSVSGFHRAFKQVTAESPLQYLKKLRLTKAKELIELQGRRASDAAMLVGYTSTSQFSREFKRHFNATPGSFSGF
jgi:AraC-like DNA-binding protein